MPARSSKRTPQELLAEAHRLRGLIIEAWNTPGLDRQIHLNFALEQWEAEFEAYRSLLKEYEASGLVQEAVKWGIDVDPEWHVEHIDIDSYRIPKMQELAWLNETGRTKLRKQIRDARFAYWKGWADILVPPLALAVALLALFKEVIVAYIQAQR